MHFRGVLFGLLNQQKLVTLQKFIKFFYDVLNFSGKWSRASYHFACSGFFAKGIEQFDLMFSAGEFFKLKFKFFLAIFRFYRLPFFLICTAKRCKYYNMKIKLF